jgi:saccharopine dehydrogenase-like NADP-dependent oxidoreductase
VKALRVAVLGAGGTIAPAIVRDLAESEEVLALSLLDLDAERARWVAEAHAPEADVRSVEPGADLAGALEGFDVVLNAASYRINLEVMHAALAVGANYLDLGGLYWMTAQQLELDSRFRSAGRLAVLGIGSSPGKTNLMALRAARELGADGLDTVHVSAAGRDLDPPGGFSPPYAVQTLVDEITLAPVVVRDGAATEIEPLSPGGMVTFPEPIGPASTIHTLHSELLTFPGSFAAREVSFRLSLAPAIEERVRELAAGTPEDVAAATREAVSSSARTVSAHVIEATVGERAVEVSALTEPHERWGLGGGIVSTGTPASATVRLLARGQVNHVGVLPPERCLEPDLLFRELEARGHRFAVAPAAAAARP